MKLDATIGAGALGGAVVQVQVELRKDRGPITFGGRIARVRHPVTTGTASKLRIRRASRPPIARQAARRRHTARRITSAPPIARRIARMPNAPPVTC